MHLSMIHVSMMYVPMIHVSIVHVSMMHVLDLRIAKFENCWIWELLNLRSDEFEKCWIWELLHLRIAGFENCQIWEMHNLRITKFEKSRIWETWGWRQIIHFEKAAISIKMVKFRVSRQFIKEGALYHKIINGTSRVHKSYNPAENIRKQLKNSGKSKIIWYYHENNWGGPVIDNFVQLEEDFNSLTKELRVLVGMGG